MKSLIAMPSDVGSPEGLAALEVAEKRGYQRGYAAKVRRVEREDAQRQHQHEKQVFRREVFLTVLPKVVDAQGWNTNGKPVTSLPQRVALAWDFADEAMKRYY